MSSACGLARSPSGHFASTGWPRSTRASGPVAETVVDAHAGVCRITAMRGERIEQLKQRVRNEYLRLCEDLGLKPVELRLLVEPTGDEDLIRNGGVARYGGEAPDGYPRYLEVALFSYDIDEESTDWPSSSRRDPEETRYSLEPVPREWPSWRVSLWHECVHQAIEDLWGISVEAQNEPGWVPNGHYRPDVVGHGHRFYEMVELIAMRFQFNTRELDDMFMEGYAGSERFSNLAAKATQ